MSVVEAAGWYPDPTGRHEWRYWRPGWTDLAADGTVEFDDPLRPRWRRLLGIVLIAQLVVVPVLGSILVEKGNKLESRVGVVKQATQDPPVASIVYAPCPGERIRRIALSTPTGGTLGEVLWSVSGDAPADRPIVIGDTPVGMQTKKQLRHPVGQHEKLVLLVSTNQLTNPAVLDFSMDDVPTSGALSYHGVYADDEEFRTAALVGTRCGAEGDSSRGILTKILVGQVVLALVGAALLLLPRHPGPASRYS